MDLSQLVGAFEAESLVRGATTGKYHLLLGAGANFGGTSRSGASLPGGVALASELKTKFNLPLAEAHLRRAFKLARRTRSVDGEDLDTFIQARFTGVTPPSWMQHMVQLPWQRIWTLNIDDAVERAYEIWESDAIVRARGVSWREGSSSFMTDQQWVHIVHLHGRASRASREGELVFTTSEYANAFGEKGFWHSHFAGEYESSPSIVVGASLDGELDLETILERRKLSFELPSFIVSPDITEDLAREYRAFDLTPIRATAADFFEALYIATTRARGQSEMKWSRPMIGVDFEKTWRRLQPHETTIADDRHDYYLGHAPEWSDIVTKMPATRRRVDGLVKRIDRQLSGTFGVHILTGEAYSGKSTALLMTARELQLRGYEPLLFSGSAAPNTKALAEYSRANPNSIFMIDGAEDFARDIAELADAHGADHTIRVILVDRSRALPHIKRSIPEHFRSQTIIRAELEKTEIIGLYLKLRGRKRLGYLAAGDQEQFLEHFARYEDRLFDGMAAVEDGSGFVDRVGNAYESLRSKPGANLVRLAALASLFDYGVPLNSLTAASSLPAAEIGRLLRETLIGDYVAIDGEQLRIRSRHFGESLWSQFLAPSDKAKTAQDLVLGVAPYVSPKAISDDALAYRIARSVMDEEFILSLHLGEREALDWFASLEQSYEWNARFWEQRALSASRAGRHEKALSWALTAINKLRDSFSLNTAGTVLMRRAVAAADEGRWPLGSFADAEQYLRQSRGLRSSGLGRDRAEYPYVTLFHGILDIYSVTGKMTGKDREAIEKIIIDWQLAAADLTGAAQSEVAPLMARVVKYW